MNDQRQRPALLKLIGKHLRQPLLPKKEKEDVAMSTPNHEGGINLNPAQMTMQIKKEGEDFKFNLNGTQIDVAQITGATFTIRTMTPVTNLPIILGLNQDFVAKSNV